MDEPERPPRVKVVDPEVCHEVSARLGSRSVFVCDGECGVPCALAGDSLTSDQLLDRLRSAPTLGDYDAAVLVPDAAGSLPGALAAVLLAQLTTVRPEFSVLQLDGPDLIPVPDFVDFKRFGVVTSADRAEHALRRRLRAHISGLRGCVGLAVFDPAAQRWIGEGALAAEEAALAGAGPGPACGSLVGLDRALAGAEHGARPSVCVGLAAGGAWIVRYTPHGAVLVGVVEGTGRLGAQLHRLEEVAGALWPTS